MKNLLKTYLVCLTIGIITVSCDPARKTTTDSDAVKIDSTSVPADSTKKDTTTVVVDSTKKDTIKK